MLSLGGSRVGFPRGDMSGLRGIGFLFGCLWGKVEDFVLPGISSQSITNKLSCPILGDSSLLHF